MATHKSAKKRARQSEKRRQRNRAIRGETRTVVKTFLAEPGSKEKLRLAERALRRAASKGIIPKRRASRRVSRLAKASNQANAGS